VIPALPCGTFSDSDTPAGAFTSPPSRKATPPHHVGEYRIETVSGRCGRSRACGYDDVEVGSIEQGGKQHLLLIGLDGERGLVTGNPVASRSLRWGWSRCGRILVTSDALLPHRSARVMAGRRWLSTTPNL